MLDLAAVTLADGRSTTLTTQIDICYAHDQRPSRISAIVLHHNSTYATGLWSQHRNGQQPAHAKVGAPSHAVVESRGHALRGPLGAVAAAVEVLRSGVGDDRLRERALQIIDRQTRQLTRLVAAIHERD